MAYLPPSDPGYGVGDLPMSPPATPVKPGGKSKVGGHINTQHYGTVVGRRGAGITTITGGDPTMHSMNHYGKKPPRTSV